MSDPMSDPRREVCVCVDVALCHGTVSLDCVTALYGDTVRQRMSET